MTRFITVVSGKGGVGKTSTAINLGAALSYFGKDVIVVDANLTTPNVGLHLGVPVVPVNLHDVLQGKNKIHDAMYIHPSGTKIVPASISVKDLKKTDALRLPFNVRKLDGSADFVIIDGAAGLGNEALGAIHSCDNLLIVTNPELPAITDALKAVKVADEIGKDVLGVVLTKSAECERDVSVSNIETLLEKPVISVIPFDSSMREALVMKDAVVFTHPKSPAAVAYKKLAAMLIGREYKEPEKEKARKGLLSRIFFFARKKNKN